MAWFASSKSSSGDKPKEGWLETAKTIAVALLIAFGIRSFLFQPFHIPSESMKPTLLVGDYLFVSKFSYGYSRHSMPFSPPVLSGRILGGQPDRGDVIVFKTPLDNRTDYIKRLVGLPGDRIQMIRGVLHINGEPVVRQRIGDHADVNFQSGFEERGTLYRETLPNGISYTTIDMGARDTDETGEFTVPAGHYFLMGDNRDNSRDSRVPVSQGGVGYVPFENLVGRAEIRFFSTDGSASLILPWTWFTAARYERFFTPID